MYLRDKKCKIRIRFKPNNECFKDINRMTKQNNKKWIAI